MILIRCPECVGHGALLDTPLDYDEPCVNCGMEGEVLVEHDEIDNELYLDSIGG